MSSSLFNIRLAAVAATASILVCGTLYLSLHYPFFDTADTHPPQVQPKPRLPIELCEHIIDAVYETRYKLIPTALATLSNCSLVCRTWRSPAQKVLFHYVVLRDKDTLYRFAKLLDAAPELGAYVRIVELRGYLHIPNSSVLSFPAVLGARLTNLFTLFIFESDADEKDANPLPDGVKELPLLPIHRLWLPSLTSISHVRSIYLYHIVFPSFGDFARILNTLSDLRELSCQVVSWVVLGQVPLCMAKRHRGSKQVFLPNLEWFQCVDMDEHGRQRLLGAVGPSLRRLDLKFPDDPKPSVEQQSSSSALNLQSLHHLNTLYYYLSPLQEPYGSVSESLRETLLSWVPSDARDQGDRSASWRDRRLYLEPLRRDGFRRQEFLELLRVIGSVVDAELVSEQPSGDVRLNAGGLQINPCWASVAVQNLGDRIEWADWWETRVQECFPVLAKWKRLHVVPDQNRNPIIKWIDHEQTPDEPFRNTHAVKTQESSGAANTK